LLKARRKAAEAVHVVSETAEAAVTKVNGRRKAPSTNFEAPATAIEQPKRKRRSDAGTKRTAKKTRPEVGAPGAFEPLSLGETETSAIALTPEPLPSIDADPSIGQVAEGEALWEAHPS
jgi:hypothetical protein